ncbi:MAG: dual specificity protein phosphatase family protein [Planctomycetes bacterium]|nr:dual specificity protein phosphatase family protein [Planctomycetota bacterium]
MCSAVEKSRSGTRRKVYGIAALCLAGIAFGGWRAYRQTRLRQFGVVKEGVLYRSGQPTEAQFDEIVDRYGIKTVVNLRSNREEEYIKKRGLRLATLPMSHTEPLSEKYAKAFLNLIDNPDNYPILVHCSEGQTRTGAMVALYRRRRCGWSRGQTIEEMKRYDFNFAERHDPLTESVLALPEESKPAKPNEQEAPAG